MDHIRKTLDELMGKDRDLPLRERMKNLKHFDSPEVCKYFLLDFCPHDLFPNTKSYLGECKKRHDQQFKTNFLKDPNREQYQQKYEEMLMDFLEELIADVDNKMKKCVERIEAPLPETERPKDVVDQIRLIDLKIGELIEQAERLGEVGRIDDSEVVIRNIDKLKEQKNEIMTMSEYPMMYREKQMKVCEVCGALQSAQDNEKRTQAHVEGKLHTGYAKVREYLEVLRRRKLERRIRSNEEKERERIHKELREKERLREKEQKGQREYPPKEFSLRRKSRSRSGERDFRKRRFDNQDGRGERGGRFDQRGGHFEKRDGRFNDREGRFNNNEGRGDEKRGARFDQRGGRIDGKEERGEYRNDRNQDSHRRFDDRNERSKPLKYEETRDRPNNKFNDKNNDRSYKRRSRSRERSKDKLKDTRRRRHSSSRSR